VLEYSVIGILVVFFAYCPLLQSSEVDVLFTGRPPPPCVVVQFWLTSPIGPDVFDGWPLSCNCASLIVVAYYPYKLLNVLGSTFILSDRSTSNITVR